jgi:hypothetical protein
MIPGVIDDKLARRLECRIAEIDPRIISAVFNSALFS